MKQNNYFKKAISIIAIYSLAFMASCGKKSENKAQPVVQPVVNGYQQCYNCQGINGPIIFTADSSDFTGSLNMRWTFVGQNIAAQTSLTPGNYYGQVATNGSLVLSQNLNLGYCMVPAGSYTLSTLQVGQWGYGIVSKLTIQAYNGPVNMQLTFNGQVSSPGSLSDSQLSSSTNPVGRMIGSLQVASVNGQQCQQIIGLQ